MLREQSGWSQNRLAKRVGVDVSHLCRVESGERELGEATAQRIAGVLGVPLNLFYDRPVEDDDVA